MTMSDDELAEDEEEVLVYVEFEGCVGGNTSNDEQLQLDMIGIDTDHPIMQINGKFFEGTYEDAVGTYMFFEPEENSTIEDPVFDTPATLKYFDKTRKVLKMQRIFVKPRTEVLGDSEHSHCIPNLATLAQAGVPLKYQEEALNFWKTMRDNRIDGFLEKQRIREEKELEGIEMDSDSGNENPFAESKQKDDVDKKESTGTESKKDDLSCPPNVDTSMDLHTKETSQEPSNANELDSTEVEKLETADPMASILEDQPSNNSGKPKSKATSVRKKKLGVVHNVRKKISKKKQTISKGEDSPAINVEDKSATVANSEESSQIEVSNNFDKIETVEHDVSDETSSSLTREPETEHNVSDTSKITKQQKREAKMKEISERLKTIAGNNTSAKTD